MIYKSSALLASESMGASFNSSPLLLYRAKGYSIQVVFTGSPVGTFKLQGSNDVTYTADDIVNWSDIADSSQAISAAGDILYEVEKQYKWVRLVYTRTSGTGTCNASYFFIEVLR